MANKKIHGHVNKNPKAFMHMNDGVHVNIFYFLKFIFYINILKLFKIIFKKKFKNVIQITILNNPKPLAGS
jgi:hypothetical protein